MSAAGAAPSKQTKLAWHERLSRVTTGGRFLPELEGLRFLSLIQTSFVHLLFISSMFLPASVDRWPELFPEAQLYGYHAFLLFFTISGFIIAMPFARAHLSGGPQPSLKSYYWRRVTRIEPPYLLNIILLFTYAVVFTAADFKTLLPHLLASLTYTHNLLYGNNSTINVVAWSLEIEVQFYLLAPLFCQIFRLRSRSLRRSLLVASMLVVGALQWIVPVQDRVWDESIFRYLQYFFAGMLFTDLFASSEKSYSSRSGKWDLLALAIVPLLVILPRFHLISLLLYSFATIAFYICAFRGKHFNRVITWTPFCVVGVMCYSIYLYHVQVITYFARRWPAEWHFGSDFALNFALQCMILVPAALVVCGVHYVLIERPCMVRDWPQRLIAKWRSSNEKAASAEAAAS